MAKITSFPITTTDQWSNESIQGLCSPLCADIQEYGTYTSGSFYQDSSGNILSGLGAISAVTFAPSAAISGYWGTSGTMTGDFISGYYNPSGDLYPSGTFISGNDITTLLSYNVTGQYDFSPSTGYVVSEYGIRKAINDYIDNAVTGINIGSGEGVFSNVTGGDIKLRSIDTQYNNRFTITSGSNGTVDIYYDGRGGTNVQQISSSFVQGGSQQLWSNILGLSGFDTGITDVVSGFSTTSIPICANMQNTSLTADEYLSGLALYDWNTDIAIGKIAARIPIDSAFVNSGEVIWVGLTGDYDRFGYFLTRTSGQITTSGEYIPLEYSQNMYEDQYEYFMTPNAIFAYTTGVTLQQDLSSNFDLRVFYDQVSYDQSIYSLFAGGFANNTTRIDTIDSYNFLTNTMSLIEQQLSNPRSGYGPLYNNIYAWYAGGYNTTHINTIDRLHKSTLTASLIGSVLSQARFYLMSARSNNTDGYLFGGQWATSNTDMIEKINFSTNAVSDTNDNLLWADDSVASVIDYPNFNYVWIAGGSPPRRTIQRYDFSTNTINQAPNGLTSNNARCNGAGNSINGYFFGGRITISGPPYSTDRIDKFILSTSTTACINTASISVLRESIATIEDNNHMSAILVGGYEPISTTYDFVEQFNFSTDTNNSIYRTKATRPVYALQGVRL